MTDEPPCSCDGPGFCPRYGIEQGGHHVHLCRTRPAYRRKWRLAAGGPPPPRSVPAPPPASPPPARTPLPVARPPCSFEGAVVSYCTSCGSKEGRHVRQCFHDANPGETCTRLPVSPAVWDCAGCPHHDPADLPRGTPG